MIRHQSRRQRSVRGIPFLLCLALLSSGGKPLPAQSRKADNAFPRLTVVISVDQLRADYLPRFGHLFLPAQQGGKVGGFRWLLAQGAHFADAHHSHLPTETGPGHAAMMTGAGPVVTGIIRNEWIDRATGKQRYCVADPLTRTIGGPSDPMSPRTLLVTTVGDELKMATNGRGKVVGISLKDRAAILLAGHAADTVLWFDENNGSWVTSAWYAPSGQLPAWVTAINAQKTADKAYRKTWEPLLPKADYALTRPAPQEPPAANGVFSHLLEGKSGLDKTYYKDGFARSPYGQEWLFETVKQAIKAEELGKDTIPDILAINLATNDYIGHAWGPYSPEILDITVRTDRLLSDFLNYLNAKIPGGLKNVLIALTGDHGVAPLPEPARDDFKLPAGRLVEDKVGEQVNAMLSAKYGKGDYILGMLPPYLYFHDAALTQKGLDKEKVAREVAEWFKTQPGIYDALSMADFLAGKRPSWPWLQQVLNSLHPTLSGDVLVFEQANWLMGSRAKGTGHGSAWAYDTQVPILLVGESVRPGLYSQRVQVFDLAPTLSHLLGVAHPSGCMGHLLPCLKP